MTNPIIQAINRWCQRHFADSAAVGLLAVLLITFLALYFFGHLLMPIIISVLIAYLLHSLVKGLEKYPLIKKLDNFFSRKKM